MSDEKHEAEQPRKHSEQPAEGNRSQDPTDSGIHSQAPAEGADTEGTEGEAERN